MDTETKKLLEENLKLTKENHELLRKVYRIHKWTQFYRVFYWLIIIGISLGAYYFIQPYVESLVGYYQAIAGSEGVQGMQNIRNTIPDIKHVQNLLEQIQN